MGWDKGCVQKCWIQRRQNLKPDDSRPLHRTAVIATIAMSSLGFTSFNTFLSNPIFSIRRCVDLEARGAKLQTSSYLLLVLTLLLSCSCSGSGLVNWCAAIKGLLTRGEKLN